MSDVATVTSKLKKSCAHCGATLKLFVLVSPFGSIRCGHCGQPNHRFISAGRVTAAFALLWAFVGAVYTFRNQTSSWYGLLSLVTAYAAVGVVIVCTAPLRIASADWQDSKLRAAVCIDLFLLTMGGIRWLREL
jgi:hypothetical protein